MAWETRILVTTNSQNVSNNTSNVTFTFQARRTDYSVYVYNAYGQAYWQIAAGGNSSGNNYFNINWRYGQNVWFTISSWTTTITHNSDGSYSSYAEAYVYTGVSPESLSARTNYTLATIPRASTISSITGDTIGSNITVNISRQSSSFVHQVWWRINGTGNWTSLGTNFGTSCTFTLPMSVCNQVTQSTTCTLNIAIRAISNGSYVGGEVWSSKTVNVPSSVVPSFSSIGVSEAVSSVASLGIYVQSKSKLNLSINGASGSYGSWITAYSINVDGQNIYAASGTTNVINGSGNLTITARITDSRGRQASKTTTINVKAYSAPRLTSYSATRQSTPTNVSVVASGSITSLLNGSTQKNSLTYVVKYKQSSASSYTSVTVKSGGLSFSNLSRTLTNIDSTKSYDIQLVLSDYFSSVTYQLKLSTTKVIMDLKSTGVGINKYHERGTLDVGGDAYVSASLHVGQSVHSEGGVAANTTSYFHSGIAVQSSNTITSTGADTTANWGSKNIGVHWYTNTGQLIDQPSRWGYVLNLGQGAEVHQIWMEQSSGSVWHRGGNGAGWNGSWRRILDSENLGIYFNRRVVDSGVSGIWDWRQWDNGMVELWGTWTGTINLGQNNYSGFHYSNSINVAYPFKLTGPKLWVDRGPSQFIAGARAFGDTETYASFTCYGHSDYSQSNVNIYLYAIGWR